MHTLLALHAVTRCGEGDPACAEAPCLQQGLCAVVALQVISGLPDGLEAPEVPTVQGKTLQGGPQMIQVCAVADLRPA